MIFDLDGTLIDTIADIGNSVNDILNEFNIAMEANHNDNQKVFKQKNKTFMNKDKSDVDNEVTLISSNKVVNTLARSTKRTKYTYET